MMHFPSTTGAGSRPEAGSGSPGRLCGPSSILCAAAIGGGAAPRPRSLALRAEPGGTHYSLAILDAENRTLLALGRFPEEEAVAAWRRLGLASGLALAIESPDGAVHIPYPQIGRVRLGTPSQRRRHALLAGRRPRFLTRRKTGRFPHRPRVHREPEIVGGMEA